MTQIAVFPGTFDPITSGHEDLIRRAARLFDEVIVAVAQSNAKRPVFSFDKRIEMAKQALLDCNNIRVKGFDTLLVDFVRDNNATIIVRGLRVATDFDYELQLASMNRSMYAAIETVFLTPSEKYSYVSSSLVREIARFNGDVTMFVNPDVAKALKGIEWP